MLLTDVVFQLMTCVLVCLICLLDYGPEAVRLKEETLCHLQRGGGSRLWWLSQVIQTSQSYLWKMLNTN